MATADTAYDVDDIIPAVKGALSNDGKMYAVPFYAESSFLMYRKDLADAAGVTIPDAPTWDEVAAAAKKMKTAETLVSAFVASQAGAILALHSAPSSTPSVAHGGMPTLMDRSARHRSPVLDSPKL